MIPVRTCPRCNDLCPQTSIHCAGCGSALLPFEEMVRSLGRRRLAAATVAPPPTVREPRRRSRCAYCGFPSRGQTCRYHADLIALDR